MLFKELKKIKKNKEFSRVYKTGKKIYVKNIGIFWVKTSLPDVSFGITTSRKFKNAVTRNRIRRRIRDAIKEKTFLKGLRFIVYAKETASKIPFAQLKQEILHGLSKAGII